MSLGFHPLFFPGLRAASSAVSTHAEKKETTPAIDRVRQENGSTKKKYLRFRPIDTSGNRSLSALFLLIFLRALPLLMYARTHTTI